MLMRARLTEDMAWCLVRLAEACSGRSASPVLGGVRVRERKERRDEREVVWAI
jgi:hypothetical protein